MGHTVKATFKVNKFSSQLSPEFLKFASAAGQDWNAG